MLALVIPLSDNSEIKEKGKAENPN